MTKDKEGKHSRASRTEHDLRRARRALGLASDTEVHRVELIEWDVDEVVDVHTYPLECPRRADQVLAAVLRSEQSSVGDAWVGRCDDVDPDDEEDVWRCGHDDRPKLIVEVGEPPDLTLADVQRPTSTEPKERRINSVTEGALRRRLRRKLRSESGVRTDLRIPRGSRERQIGRYMVIRDNIVVDAADDLEDLARRHEALAEHEGLER